MQTSFLLLEHLGIVKTWGSHLKVAAAKHSNLLPKPAAAVQSQLTPECVCSSLSAALNALVSFDNPHKVFN